MRLGDLDALRKNMEFVCMGIMAGTEPYNAPLTIIDNAPTVEAYTKEDMAGAYNEGYACGSREAKRPQGEWIPITEKLPNTLGVYNVTRKLKEGETIYFISDASYFDGQNTWHSDICVNHGRPYLTDIIAWQPLPESYKEGVAE